MKSEISQTGPALFFCINDELLFHSCAVSEGEAYGKFVNFPHSHDSIWRKHYARKYGVDFDYYPRGRVVYRGEDNTYLIYYDRCMEPYIHEVTEMYESEKYIMSYDFHYQCKNCNKGYIGI